MFFTVETNNSVHVLNTTIDMTI